MPGSIGGPGVEIEGEAHHHGVCERAVAAESLDFLLDVLHRARPRVEAHLAGAPHALQAVAAFFARAVLCVTQVRALAFQQLVPRLLPESGAVPGMINDAKLKWDAVRDAMEPSKYAAADLPPCVARAGALLAERTRAGALPDDARFSIWACVVGHVLERFVEGFARVKKCSVPGRGLMSLDAGTVFALCCRASPVLPQLLARDRAFVDAWVAANYFDSESDLLDWVSRSRGAYTLRAMRALVNAGPLGASLKAKAKRDLLAAIEAMYVLPEPEKGAADRALAASGTAATLAGYGLASMGAAMLNQ
jgi:hypothetical protein